MTYFYKIAIFILLLSPCCFATHITGGEIRASYVSGQTYKISVLLYFDIVNGAAAVNAQNDIQACMGDGNVITISRASSYALSDSSGIGVGLYEANYTYPSSGTFQISVSESTRTNALNFPEATSSPFFIWTVLNTQMSNVTPVLPNLNFKAAVRQVFSLDLKATVSDADSISARIQKLSKPSPGTCGVRSLEQSFTFPNDVTKNGTFKINRADKKLVWTAPEQVGRYLYAMVVDEWRDGIKISETYREGTIFVTDKAGPSVEIPPYVYAQEAGDEVITSIPKLDTPEASIAVEAFPIPTADFITVKAYSKNRSVIRLQVIDLQGRVLQEIKSSAPEIAIQRQFDLSNYAKGIYLIRAVNDNESVTQKILR